mgnify:CR=1 FL=1
MELVYLIKYLHQITAYSHCYINSFRVYLIKYLHQITAIQGTCKILREVYLIKYLHQITAERVKQSKNLRYILSSIYIKSQQYKQSYCVDCWYILSSIYIKSQQYLGGGRQPVGISYQVFTSNHSSRPVKALKFKTFHEIQARKNADFCFLGADLMTFSDFNISKNKCIKKVPIV